jgi:hypothetical protein
VRFCPGGARDQSLHRRRSRFPFLKANRHFRQ